MFNFRCQFLHHKHTPSHVCLLAISVKHSCTKNSRRDLYHLYYVIDN